MEMLKILVVGLLMGVVSPSEPTQDIESPAKSDDDFEVSFELSNNA